MQAQAVPTHLSPGPLSRAIGAAIVAKRNGPSRKALERRQLAAMGIPEYASDLSMRRGRCFKCKARYSVVRATFDYTSARAVEPFAHVECAKCGHVWYRTSVPKLGQYQSVRLTLILPSEQRRWFSRGRWHVQGTDAVVIADATWSDLMDAAADWRTRNSRYAASIARAKERRAAKETEAMARYRETVAAYEALRAAREAQESEDRSRDMA